MRKGGWLGEGEVGSVKGCGQSAAGEHLPGLQTSPLDVPQGSIWNSLFSISFGSRFPGSILRMKRGPHPHSAGVLCWVTSSHSYCIKDEFHFVNSHSLYNFNRRNGELFKIWSWQQEVGSPFEKCSLRPQI